jgi:hypothetical protein
MTRCKVNSVVRVQELLPFRRLAPRAERRDPCVTDETAFCCWCCSIVERFGLGAMQAEHLASRPGYLALAVDGATPGPGLAACTVGGIPAQFW